MFGFKDNQGKFRPTGRPTGERGGIYQKRDETGKIISAKSTYGKDHFYIPGISNALQNRRDEMAYKKSTKEQNQKIKAKEKTNTKELLDEEKIKEKGKDGRQEIRKLLEKGKISSGEARIRFGKLETKTETVQKGKLPSGRVEMTESSKKLLKNHISLKEKYEKELETLNALESGNAERIDIQGYPTQKELEADDKIPYKTEEYEKEKKELEEKIKDRNISILQITGKDPDSMYYASPLIRKSDDVPFTARQTESDKGALPMAKTVKDRESAEDYALGKSGEAVPTFEKNYQTKRIDPYTGEFTSQMADTRIQKQLENMFRDAEKQGYVSGESNEDLEEALKNISSNTNIADIDPTQHKEPKGMWALRGVRAEMAGRRN